jgi:hypothetical protein
LTVYVSDIKLIACYISAWLPCCFSDCPDIYVSPTTISPLTTDSNIPISPINKTTDDQKETTTIAIETKDHSSMTSVSNETPSTSDTITKDAIDDKETSYRRSTYEYISSSSGDKNFSC